MSSDVKTVIDRSAQDRAYDILCKTTCRIASISQSIQLGMQKKKKSQIKLLFLILPKYYSCFMYRQ